MRSQYFVQIFAFLQYGTYRTSGELNVYNELQCDQNDYLVNDGTIGEYSDFPWLGVLRVQIEINSRRSVAMTGIVLISHSFALVNADDVAKIPDELFRRNSSAYFIVKGSALSANPTRFVVHPEYYEQRCATIGLVWLELGNFDYSITPICLPLFPFTVDHRLYSLGYTDEHKNLEKRLHRLVYVEKEDCDQFYLDAKATEKKFQPLHYRCGLASTSGDSCVWNTGMVMTSNTSGIWILIGLGVKGPKCRFPERFIDISHYTDWIDSFAILEGEQVVDEYGNVLRQRNVTQEYIPLQKFRQDNSSNYVPPPTAITINKQTYVIDKIDEDAMQIRQFEDYYEMRATDCKQNYNLIYSEVTNITYPSHGGLNFATYKLTLYDFFVTRYACVHVQVKAKSRQKARLFYKMELLGGPILSEFVRRKRAALDIKRPDVEDHFAIPTVTRAPWEDWHDWPAWVNGSGSLPHDFTATTTKKPRRSKKRRKRPEDFLVTGVQLDEDEFTTPSLVSLWQLFDPKTTTKIAEQLNSRKKTHEPQDYWVKGKHEEHDTSILPVAPLQLPWPGFEGEVTEDIPKSPKRPNAQNTRPDPKSYRAQKFIDAGQSSTPSFIPTRTPWVHWHHWEDDPGAGISELEETVEKPRRPKEPKKKPNYYWVTDIVNYGESSVSSYTPTRTPWVDWHDWQDDLTNRMLESEETLEKPKKKPKDYWVNEVVDYGIQETEKTTEKPRRPKKPKKRPGDYWVTGVVNYGMSEADTTTEMSRRTKKLEKRPEDYWIKGFTGHYGELTTENYAPTRTQWVDWHYWQDDSGDKEERIEQPKRVKMPKKLEDYNLREILDGVEPTTTSFPPTRTPWVDWYEWQDTSNSKAGTPEPEEITDKPQRSEEKEKKPEDYWLKSLLDDDELTTPTPRDIPTQGWQGDFRATIPPQDETTENPRRPTITKYYLVSGALDNDDTSTPKLTPTRNPWEDPHDGKEDPGAWQDWHSWQGGARMPQPTETTKKPKRTTKKTTATSKPITSSKALKITTARKRTRRPKGTRQPKKWPQDQSYWFTEMVDDHDFGFAAVKTTTPADARRASATNTEKGDLRKKKPEDYLPIKEQSRLTLNRDPYNVTTINLWLEFWYEGAGALVVGFYGEKSAEPNKGSLKDLVFARRRNSKGLVDDGDEEYEGYKLQRHKNQRRT